MLIDPSQTFLDLLTKWSSLHFFEGWCLIDAINTPENKYDKASKRRANGAPINETSPPPMAGPLVSATAELCSNRAFARVNK